MRVLSRKVHHQHLLQHTTKKEALVRFALVFLFFLGYFIFISFHYGAKQGLMVSWLTWSAFVLGTPVADAGFLIDFPLRLLTRIRMVFAEMIVWFTAISLNLYALLVKPELYQSSTVLKIFHQVLVQPIPYWLIIIISAAGTFLSIHFGDELLDKREHHQRHFYHQHKQKHQLIVFLFLFVLVLLIYKAVVQKLGTNL